MTTDIHLVRHGHDDRTRVPGGELTPEGHAQARALRSWFQGIPADVVVSSTLRRARSTAAHLVTPHGPGRKYADHRFDEVGDLSVGMLSGPPRLVRGAANGGGWDAFVSRVRSGVVALTSDPCVRTCVVVAHSGVFDAVFEIASGSEGRVELAVDYGATSHWQYRPGDLEGEWLLLSHNVVPIGDLEW